MVPELRVLARTYHEQGRFTEAKRLLEVSLAILENALGPLHPEKETALMFYSEILRVLNLDAHGRHPAQ